MANVVAGAGVCYVGGLWQRGDVPLLLAALPHPTPLALGVRDELGTKQRPAWASVRLDSALVSPIPPCSWLLRAQRPTRPPFLRMPELLRTHVGNLSEEGKSKANPTPKSPGKTTEIRPHAKTYEPRCK